MDFSQFIRNKLTTTAKNIVDAINEHETSKQNKLTAGDGISIADDVISVTGSGAYMVDWIVEQRYDAPIGEWNYTKWASGKWEGEIITSHVNVVIGTQAASGYASSWFSMPALPSGINFGSVVVTNTTQWWCYEIDFSANGNYAFRYPLSVTTPATYPMYVKHAVRGAWPAPPRPVKLVDPLYLIPASPPKTVLWSGVFDATNSTIMVPGLSSYSLLRIQYDLEGWPGHICTATIEGGAVHGNTNKITVATGYVSIASFICNRAGDQLIWHELMGVGQMGHIPDGTHSIPTAITRVTQITGII